MRPVWGRIWVLDLVLDLVLDPCPGSDILDPRISDLNNILFLQSNGRMNRYILNIHQISLDLDGWVVPGIPPSRDPTDRHPGYIPAMALGALAVQHGAVAGY